VQKTKRFSFKIEILLFIFIMLCAVALRTLGLVGAPPGFSDDELADLRIITDAVHSGEITVFYGVGDAHGDREGLYYPLLSVFAGVVGDGLYGYRVLSLLVGTLTLAFTFSLARLLFGSRAAVLALGAMAVGYWPVFTSRVVGRHMLMPLLAAATVYFVVRSVTTPSAGPDDQAPTINMALAGLLMSAALYVQWTGIALVIGFLLFGAYLRYRYRRFAFRQAGNASFALLIAIIVAIPFSVSVLRTPEVTTLSHHLSDIVNALPESIFDTLRGLFLEGDPNPTHNLPGRPVFDPLSAAAFIVGAVVTVRRWRRPTYALLAISLLVSLPPDALSSGGPDFTRLAVAMPALYITAGVGFDVIVHRLTRAKRWGGPLVQARVAYLALAALFVAGVTYTNRDLNHVWANRDDVFVAYHAHLGRLAAHLDATAGDLPTTVCSPYLDPTNPAELDDREMLAYMMHRSGLPVRYADCQQSLVLADGGARQQVTFTYRNGPDAMPPSLAAYFADAEALDVPGMLPGSAFEIDVETQLHDLLGSFITTAPAGFAPEASGGSGPVTLPVRFGGYITFEGYQVGADAYDPGDTIEVVTYWRKDGETPANVSLFAHVLSDPVGAPAVQSDRLGIKVETLQPGDVFVQVSLLELPEHILRGEYDISVGLYVMPRGPRLSVLDGERERGDRLFLRQVQIGAADEAADG
jgi:4-amino-4-deoxy-L-arabinose transferase-like glycosyltransferase